MLRDNIYKAFYIVPQLLQLADLIVKENNFSYLVKILDTRSVPLAFFRGEKKIMNVTAIFWKTVCSAGH